MAESSEVKFIDESVEPEAGWRDKINKGHVACKECEPDEVCGACEHFGRRVERWAIGVNYSGLREKAVQAGDVNTLIRIMWAVAQRYEGNVRELADDLLKLGAVSELARQLSAIVGGGYRGSAIDVYSLGGSDELVKEYGRMKGVVYDLVLANMEKFKSEPVAMLFVAKYDNDPGRVDFAIEQLVRMVAYEEIAVLREHAHNPEIQLRAARILDENILCISTPRAVGTVIKFGKDEGARSVAMRKYRSLSRGVRFSTDRLSRKPQDFEGEIDYTPFIVEETSFAAL